MMIKKTFGAASLAAIFAASLTPVQAQSDRLPETYSFSAKSEMVWPNSTHKVNRNGSKELVEIKNESGDFHIVQLFDFQAHRLYTSDLNAKTCTAQEYVSPYASVGHDPIGSSEEMRREMAGNPPKILRRESVNGIATKVVEMVIPEAGGKYTFWLDEKFSFPVKQTIALPKKPEKVMLEIRQLSYASSPASLFVEPSECTRVAGETSATGGHAEMDVDVSASGTVKLGEGEPATSAPASGKVTVVQLRLIPERFSGRCPSPVKLIGDITTDGPATVWYEFLAGAVRIRGAGEGTVTFKVAGTQQITLEAEYVATPQVPESLLLAAEVNADGGHGPQTVSSEPALFNAKCN